jgi:transposase-like protein
MRSQKGREARAFTPEFKEAAVRRLLAGESGTALSRELDVRRGVLYRWRDAYRAEGVRGLSRKRGRPAPGHEPPPKLPRDPRDERIAALERLAGQQAAELHFFETAFRALNLATPGHDAPGASGSTRPSSRSTPKAGSASRGSASSEG